MNHAVEWFKNPGDIKKVHLYTHDHNVVAQSLYKKFGFRKSGTTWHYFVPFESIKPLGEYSCQEILADEIDFIGERYPSLPAAQIRRYLENTQTKQHVLTLKDREGNIVGVARLTPSFPGSFPFEISGVDGFDDHVVPDSALPAPGAHGVGGDVQGVCCGCAGCTETLDVRERARAISELQIADSMKGDLAPAHSVIHSARVPDLDSRDGSP